MMKVKLLDVFNAFDDKHETSPKNKEVPPIEILYNQPIPIKYASRLIGMKVLELTRKLNPIFADIAKERVRLFKKYGEVDKETNLTRIPKDKLNDLNIEISSLLESETEIDLNKIDYPLDILAVSPKVIDALDPFINFVNIK